MSESGFFYFSFVLNFFRCDNIAFKIIFVLNFFRCDSIAFKKIAAMQNPIIIFIWIGKFIQKYIIVELILIASTNMNTLGLIWTFNTVSISLESPNHWICKIWKNCHSAHFLYLPPPYWSFSKSAGWDNFNEYKTPILVPKKTFFYTWKFFSIYKNWNIFKLGLTPLFKNSIKFEILGCFQISKKWIWSSQCIYLSLE